MKWTGFKKRYWLTHENQCEVCGSLSNSRQGRPVPGLRMDIAHLVSRCELAEFGDVSRPFATDEDNFVTLCQQCHAAFDTWCGVMGLRRSRRTPHFTKYESRFLPLLRRRSRLLETLISLTADPSPTLEALGEVESGGSCGLAGESLPLSDSADDECSTGSQGGTRAKIRFSFGRVSGQGTDGSDGG